MKLKTCGECLLHFALIDSVELIDDKTKCDYHTDFTGRTRYKARLEKEWNEGYPIGWRVV